MMQTYPKTMEEIEIEDNIPYIDLSNISKEQYLKVLAPRDRTKYWTSSYGKYALLKLNAKRRNIIVSFSKEEFTEWLVRQEYTCPFCNIELTNGTNKLNSTMTIDRIDNKNGYELDNITLCCWQCNRTKGDYLSNEEMIKVGKLFKEFRELRTLNKEVSL
jgi:5-methylcytosine-specific restriction endonuclease McrA